MLSHEYCMQKMANAEQLVSVSKRLGGPPPAELKQLIEKLLHCGHADIEERAKRLHSELPGTKRFWHFWK